MRTYLLASPLLLLAAACADPNPEPDDLAASRDAWVEARDESSASYSYVRYEEYWTGQRFETTVVVANDEVIERSYVAYDGEELTTEWTEYGVDLGTHSSGFPAVTLDDLYDQCADDVMPRVDEVNPLTFTTFENGLLQNCYTVDQSLDDSGANGVQLISIEIDPLPCKRGVPCG